MNEPLEPEIVDDSTTGQPIEALDENQPDPDTMEGFGFDTGASASNDTCYCDANQTGLGWAPIAVLLAFFARARRSRRLAPTLSLALASAVAIAPLRADAGEPAAPAPAAAPSPAPAPVSSSPPTASAEPTAKKSSRELRPWVFTLGILGVSGTIAGAWVVGLGLLYTQDPGGARQQLITGTVVGIAGLAMLATSIGLGVTMKRRERKETVMLSPMGVVARF